MSNKNSEARIAANNRYNAKTYDRINIAIPKGKKDEIKAIAEKNGESVNGFIVRLIEAELERLSGERDSTGGSSGIPTPSDLQE